MCPHAIIGADVSQDVTLEFIKVMPRTTCQTFALQDAEPDLDLIQPRTMLGQEMPDHPTGMRFHPGEGFRRGSGFRVVADQM